MFYVAGPKAFAEAGITHDDADHLMIYNAPCSLPGQALRICLSTASKISAWCRAAKPAPLPPSGKLPAETNLGLPRRRRHVRRVRHDHHVERGTVGMDGS